MELLVAGAIVCVALWGLGYLLGSPLTVGLFGSFAFGSTAIATLGGSTVPVFAASAIVLLAHVAMQRDFMAELVSVFETQPIAQMTFLLTLHAVATAFVLPRLFAREATAIVPFGFDMLELPVGPVAGNFNQSAYFMLNALVFFAVTILLRRGHGAQIRLGFLAWASMHALLGVIDVAGKVLGLGDVLEPVRTAGYAMLGDHAVVGFWRIMGGFPEASAYAAVALQALAFAYVDWRTTRSRLSLTVATALLLLLLFSTSSTGYAGLAILLMFAGLFALLSIMRGCILVEHLALLGVALVGFVAVAALYLYEASLLRPFTDMLLDATLNKSASDSAAERSHWNWKSVEAFINTAGIGIGLGSSRSSSWPVSVVSQLGVIGATGFAVAVGALFFGLMRLRGRGTDQLAESASAAALAGCAAGSFGGSGADPGMIFFIALATVSAAISRRAASVRYAR